MNTFQLAQAVGERLQQKKLFLVTAESCTGGGIADAMTAVAGSSGWFERGIVTYSNQAKNRYLQVPMDLIDQHDAVSQQVAAAMALGAAERNDEVSISVTGLAGPDGGSDKKPVGTVWFGFSIKGNVVTICQHFMGDRQAVRAQAVAFALSQLLKQLAD